MDLEIGLGPPYASAAMSRPVSLLVALAALAAAAAPAHAVTCAAGVHRAGCVGPNGAVATHRPAAAAPVKCAAGVHRAGCVGPNGAVATTPNGAVVAKPHPHCYWRAGVKVCK